ncbi:luciferin 4-monooxygenase-like [Amblyomma americanum]
MTARSNSPEEPLTSDDQPLHSEVYLVIEDNVVKTCVKNAIVPDVNFVTFFTNMWQKHEDKVALVDVKSGAQYTFGELLDASRRVAAGLRQLGLRTGDVVGFHCANGTELIVALCGTFFAGGIAAFVKTNLTQGEARHQLRDVEPTFVVCDIEDIKKIKDACDGLASVQLLIVTTGTCDEALSLSELKRSHPEQIAAPLNLNADSVLAILYSSGSTGLPKGVQLNHRNLISQVISHGYLDPSVFESSDVYIAVAPIMHVGGFWLIFSYLGQGCKVIAVHTTDFDVVLPAIERHRPTMTALFPTLLLKLDQHPLLGKVDTSSMKKLFVGGTTVSSSLLQSVVRKLGLKGVTQAYGMTELTGCITFSTPLDGDFRSVGRPAPFVELKVADVCTRKALGPNKQGEICVKGACTFKAYLRKPKETDDIYEDGFICTGDVGYYVPDGRFFVCGRLKELIKCMDQQVAPAELEDLLAADWGVRHVVVAGVPHAEYGETARAFVVSRQRLRPGSIEEQREVQRLQELVAAELAYHKHLHGGVEFLDSIPLTETGKYQRRALRDAYIQRQGLRTKEPVLN